MSSMPLLKTGRLGLPALFDDPAELTGGQHI